ncbi:glycosyltransferase family 4 protein [Granulosicoccus sp. 3-233]|uniref:glycosyltransferase family 4 protein n=1 Tax=Granulosicoccus sp. 3-233 TaxID=3417969 RepID=UPI003D33C91D
MHPNDVKITRLTRNLINLSEEVAAYSVSEARRYKAGMEDARKAALMSVQEEPKAKKRGRAAVVSWDLAHNPAGRAYVLYQLLKKDWNVDLIGPMWPRYGTSLWGPLANADMRIRSFHCADISEFVPKAEALAAGQHYDIVYVCKPRLPSLYLGALIKEACDCPLVLDVDDFELSFFRNEEYASVDDLKSDLHAALHLPFEELGTRYAQTLIPAADAITVSNVALRSRFGGHMIRHARDELQFRNSSEKRAAARQKLGIAETDFALLFIGTPRPHKGVLEVTRALDELDDPDMVFHIVGSITDASLKERLASYSRARVVLHPNCSFDELPELLAGADLVPLIQDVDHAISQYQIPAKVSDALSLGVPVIATRTPPLEDLIASGAIRETDNEGLRNTIAGIKAAWVKEGGRTSPDIVNQERRSFLSELGLAVNRTRLDQAISEARDTCERRTAASEPESVVSLFSARKSVDDERGMPAALAELVDIFRNHYRGLRGEVFRSARERRGELASTDVASGAAGKTSRFPSLIRSRSSSYDIAFFWKQNDSNIYGRRSDMIAKEFARSGRIRKMVHFDAPVSTPSMNDQFENPKLVKNGQQQLIMTNLIDRQMGIYDTSIVRHRTHVFSRQPRPARLLGQEVHSKGSYVRFVNEQLEEHGMRARNTVAWFCPVIWDAPELIEKVGFGGVIADLIDDQRAWDGTPTFKRQLEKSYHDTLGSADLVFANCDSLAEAMQEHASDRIHVVANGAERFDRFPDAPVPDSLKDIKGPVVGYVGNLRDRIDWTLLHEVVAAMPDVSFVFFGPSSDNPNADSLAKHDNVHVPGVVRYDELAFHLKSLDVGIVPHLNNQLTERMNPLKVYNYFAAGLPIVSSEVANLESLGSALKTATTAAEFVLAIRESLENPVDTRSAQWQSTMDTIAWESRVGEILDIMDQSLHRKLRKSA